MKYCQNCGKKIKNNVIYCPYCGTKQMKVKSNISYKTNKKLAGPFTVTITLFLDALAIAIMILSMFLPYKPKVINYAYICIEAIFAIYNGFFYAHFRLHKVFKWIISILIILFIVFTYISIIIALNCSME